MSAFAINAARGEAGLSIGGRTIRLCLTLGALAELEAAFAASGVAELAQRLRSLTARDLLNVLAILARGGGEIVSLEDLASVDPAAAARAVAEAFGAAAR